MPTTNDCPNGHPLGTVEGCADETCLERRLYEQCFDESDLGTLYWSSRHARKILRAAVEPLQARVKSLSLENAHLREDCHDTSMREASLAARVRELEAKLATPTEGGEIEKVAARLEFFNHYQAARVLRNLSEALAAKDAEIEQLQVQLAGCLTAAEGTGPRAEQGDYGWSPAYAAVLRLRAAKDAELRRVREKLGNLLKSADASWEENDEGHDWRLACMEARGVLGWAGRIWPAALNPKEPTDG